jgi:hypothetical protein
MLLLGKINDHQPSAHVTNSGPAAQHLILPMVLSHGRSLLQNQRHNGIIVLLRFLHRRLVSSEMRV